MENNFILVGILMVLPIISCGVTYGPIFRSDYTNEENAGGWLKFHRMPLTKAQAHLTCLNEGAVLASPHNEDLNKALSTMMLRHGVPTSPIFTGITTISSTSESKSIEGVPESNTYTRTSEHCVVMNVNGTIAETSCLDYYPFACYRGKSNNILTACNTTDTEYVLDNRTGSCYKVYRDLHKWCDASKICIADGGHLAVINSQQEAEVIWELAKDSLSVYAVSIGFRATHTDTGRKWYTVQDQSLEEAGYARWFQGEPNSYNENCGSVIFRGPQEDGILNDVTCDLDLMFICEKYPKKHIKIEDNKTSTTTTADNNKTSNNITTANNLTSTNTTIVDNKTYTITKTESEIVKLGPIKSKEAINVTAICGSSDYVLVRETGSCYKVFPEQHKWIDAYKICKAEGSHLAIINSQEEAEVIWELAKNSSSEYAVAIGFAAEWMNKNWRIWLTSKGETLEEAGYAKWFTGEPNSRDENCGSVIQRGAKEDGILNDVSCDLNLTFICEREAFWDLGSIELL